MRRPIASVLALFIVSVLLGACAITPEEMYEEGLELIEQGKWEEGVSRIDKAAASAPRDPQLRIQHAVRRDQVMNGLFAQATQLRAVGKSDEAEVVFSRILRIDPSHARAQAGLQEIHAERRHAQLLTLARDQMLRNDLDAARNTLRTVLTEAPNSPEARALMREIDTRIASRSVTPALKSIYARPVSLEFRDAPLKLVFDAISRTTGINFVFDKDVKLDTRATLLVRQVGAAEAIEMLLIPNQLDKKVLNENTLLVYPNAPAKLRDYQDLVIRSFHLGNADPKQVLNMIKTMLKTKDLFVDEKVNLLIMRDTPDAIRLAEKLIAAQDMAEPEVTLEVEILEVNRSKLTELGFKFPTVLSGPAGTLRQAADITQDTVNVNAGLLLNLKKEDGNTNLLASPRIRVRNREKARIHIGDRVPVVSATVTPSTGTPVVTEQIQYVDVGIKLEVEPTVHMNDDVGIKISLEASTFQRLPPTANGTQAIQVSTRNANTGLRLKDGETQVLTGLLRDDDSKTATKVPILGDIPLLGRLFTSQLDDAKKSEIVMLITPHVVRNLVRPDTTITELWSGTESTLRATLPNFSRPDQTVIGTGVRPPAQARAAAQTPQPQAGAQAQVPGQTTTAAPAVAPAAGAAVAPAGAAAGQAAAPAAADQATGAAVAAVAPAAAPADPNTPAGLLALSWSAPQSIKAGEEFTVTLMARTDTPIKGTAIQMQFDPRSVEILQVDEGNFFKQANANMVFTHGIDVNKGRVRATLTPQKDASAKGEGSLLTLRLKAQPVGRPSSLYFIATSATDTNDSALQVKPTGSLALAITKAEVPKNP